MSERLLWLTIRLMAFGLLAALPAVLLGGPMGLAYLGTALLLCVVGSLPGHLLMQRAAREAPEMVPFALLAGSGLRMLLVLAVGLLASLVVGPAVEGFSLIALWISLLACYLVVLALETTWLVAEQRASGSAKA